jgi:hypothetical protein
MTIEILLIAALHGLPVYLVAVRWSSWLLTTAVALVMSAVAVSIGGSGHTEIDLVFIGISAILGFLALPRRPAKRRPQVSARSSRTLAKVGSRSAVDFRLGVLVLAFVGAALAIGSGGEDARVQTALASPPGAESPSVAVGTDANRRKIRSQVPRSIAPHKGLPGPDRDVRHCLSMPNNEAIVRCANDDPGP